MTSRICIIQRSSTPRQASDEEQVARGSITSVEHQDGTLLRTANSLTPLECSLSMEEQWDASFQSMLAMQADVAGTISRPISLAGVDH